jgi:MFS family permease
MTGVRAMSHETFSSLHNRNYRRFLTGQSVSMIGTWMQSVAQSWLILVLTGSGTAVGGVVAVQTLPVLLLGPYAGVVVDRADKRRLLIGLQALMGVQALVLGLLTVTHHEQVWEVFALALILGMNNAFENPGRQAFMVELVGREDLRNAVSLNSVMVNVARAIGPAIAGIVIAAGGIGFCFLFNAASFIAVIASLAMLDLSLLRPSEPTGRGRGQLRDGLRYVARTPEIGIPLAMMAMIGCFVYEFQVVLPVLAKHDLHGGSQTYGFITAAMGVGAIVGGLYVAARGRTGTKVLVRSSVYFGLALVAAALAPNLATELVAIALVGGMSIGVLAQGNSTLQLAASPTMRGRVMALWAVAFLGSTPIGGPIAGAVSEQFGGRGGLLLGVVTCFLVALGGWLALRRSERRTVDTAPADAEPLELETRA